MKCGIARMNRKKTVTRRCGCGPSKAVSTIGGSSTNAGITSSAIMVRRLRAPRGDYRRHPPTPFFVDFAVVTTASSTENVHREWDEPPPSPRMTFLITTDEHDQLL